MERIMDKGVSEGGVSSRLGAYGCIKKIETRVQVFRIDNRSPERLLIDKGLPARVSQEHMRYLSRECVGHYDHYNISPFGYGTCETVEHLDKEFIKPNLFHFQHAHVYCFIGHGFFINEFKKHIVQANERDYEGEFLVTHKVALKDFLIAIAPEYREKLKSNAMVPNDGIKLNPELPPKLRLNNLESPSATLEWLLDNDAKKTAIHYAKNIYLGKSEEYIERSVESREVLNFVMEHLAPRVFKTTHPAAHSQVRSRV